MWKGISSLEGLDLSSALKDEIAKALDGEQRKWFLEKGIYDSLAGL